jgi:hypothetical protein
MRERSRQFGLRRGLLCLSPNTRFAIQFLDRLYTHPSKRGGKILEAGLSAESLCSPFKSRRSWIPKVG